MHTFRTITFRVVVATLIAIGSGLILPAQQVLYTVRGEGSQHLFSTLR